MAAISDSTRGSLRGVGLADVSRARSSVLGIRSVA
jgi:hypothetical protein